MVAWRQVYSPRCVLAASRWLGCLILTIMLAIGWNFPVVGAAFLVIYLAAINHCFAHYTKTKGQNEFLATRFNLQLLNSPFKSWHTGLFLPKSPMILARCTLLYRPMSKICFSLPGQDTPRYVSFAIVPANEKQPDTQTATGTQAVPTTSVRTVGSSWVLQMKEAIILTIHYVTAASPANLRWLVTIVESLVAGIMFVDWAPATTMLQGWIRTMNKSDFAGTWWSNLQTWRLFKEVVKGARLRLRV